MAIDDRLMSLLPVTNQPWPPPQYDPINYQYRLWDAWYSGEVQKLSWAYYLGGTTLELTRLLAAPTSQPPASPACLSLAPVSFAAVS